MMLIFIVSMLISLGLTPLAIKLAPKIGAIDVPLDDRRMHKKAMPRCGGLAIYMASMASMLIFFDGKFDQKIIGLVIGATIIFLIGLIDDIKRLPAKVKLVGQIVSALVLYASSVKISFISNPWGPDIIEFPWIVSLLVTVLWIVGITNTINLIDGLDGLAAGISFIATLCIAYIAIIHNRLEVAPAFLALAGSCLGFLPWNFHPAKVFMGDGGALYLGFMIAALSVLSPMKSATVVATILPLFVLALPILDTALAIIRRLRMGKSIMEADRYHLHHRILSVGMGHKRTVLTLYCISGIMGVAAILISRELFTDGILLIVIAVTLVYVFMKDRGFGKPFKENGEDKQ